LPLHPITQRARRPLHLQLQLVHQLLLHLLPHLLLLRHCQHASQLCTQLLGVLAGAHGPWVVVCASLELLLVMRQHVPGVGFAVRRYNDHPRPFLGWAQDWGALDVIHFEAPRFLPQLSTQA
jgi:hypothetical protein